MDELEEHVFGLKAAERPGCARVVFDVDGGGSAKHAFLLLADLLVRGLRRVLGVARAAHLDGLDDASFDRVAAPMRACGVVPLVHVSAASASALDGQARLDIAPALALPDDGLPLEAYALRAVTPAGREYTIRFALSRGAV